MIGVKNRGQFTDSAVEDEFEWADSRISSIFLAEHNEDGTHRFADPSLGIVPLGACLPYTLPTTSGADIPRGFLLCDGREVDRVTYKAYFDRVGTTYGAGDGVLTFNLPDMRQRVPIGVGAAGTASTLGEEGGALDHTHSFGSHTHSVAITSTSSGDHSHGGNTGTDGAHTHTYSDTTSTPSSSVEVQSGTGSDAASTSHTHTSTNTTSSDGSHSHTISSSGGHTHDVSGNTGSASAGSSGTNNQAYLALHFIVFVGV